MDFIRQHIRNLQQTFQAAASASHEDMPRPKVPTTDLIVEQAFREFHRDVILDMHLPTGTSTEVQHSIAQALDEQAATLRQRVEARAASKRMREVARAYRETSCH